MADRDISEDELFVEQEEMDRQFDEIMDEMDNLVAQEGIEDDDQSTS